MCYMLIAAVPHASRRVLERVDHPELMTWPIANADISQALPDGYRTYVLGQGNHCSCGWVQHAKMDTNDGNFVQLEPDVCQVLADAAKRSSQIAFVVHWATGDMDTEHVELSFGPGLSPFELAKPNKRFMTDQLVWVAPTNRISEASITKLV